MDEAWCFQTWMYFATFLDKDNELYQDVDKVLQNKINLLIRMSCDISKIQVCLSGSTFLGSA